MATIDPPRPGSDPAGTTTATATAAGTDANWPVPGRSTNLVLLCCWVAILSEGYDVGVFGAVLPALLEHPEWALTKTEAGALGSYALFGMLIGAMCIGTLSDLIGRKKMLLLSMLIFTSTQIGVALAPSPEVFGLFRFLGGLGMGGIIPVAAALTIEYSRPRRRSLNYGLMYSGYSLGIVVAALAAYFFLADLGWRWVIGFAAFPIVLIPVLAALLPESLEYLTGKGKTDRAERLASKLGVQPYRTDDWAPPITDESGKVGWRQVLASMFRGRYALATICFWISLFCGLLLVYGLNTWLPQLMKSAGYQLGSSLLFLLVFSLASAIGGVFIGAAADKYGKKVILVVFYALGSAGILALMFPASTFILYVFVALAGIGTISTSLVLTGWVADYYPPHARATATGWALSFARIGAIVGPVMGGIIGDAQLPFQVNFVIFAAIGLVAAITIALIPKARPAELAA